jgi:type I restriction enzyme S subunit
MKKIFNQEIRFKDDNGNEFPDWEEKRLGEVCKIQKGKQLNKSELIDTGEYPAINGGINPSGYTDEWNTVADTITISEGGNSCGYVNYIKTNFWCGGHCYSLLEIQNYLQKVYLFEYLKFRESSIMNLRVGSGLPNIQKREIDSFHILIPSINEQKTISSFLSTIGNQIELLETQIDKSKTWKKGLLQKMFV